MEKEGEPQAAEDEAKRLHQKVSNRAKNISFVILGVGLIGIESFQFWQLHKIREDLGDLQWNVALHNRDDESVITPEVGTIQFLKKGGHSIELETVKYSGDGLYLKGFVGNPTNLWVTSLSLKFTATKQLYQYEDDYKKDRWVLFFSPTAIGEAQCSPIATLGPGLRHPFEVSIPNVKQTKEGIRLVVAFTGERYSYAP
jgi:hypothetical protein